MGRRTDDGQTDDGRTDRQGDEWCEERWEDRMDGADGGRMNSRTNNCRNRKTEFNNRHTLKLGEQLDEIKLSIILSCHLTPEDTCILLCHLKTYTAIVVTNR